jgi:hypothetical protein
VVIFSLYITYTGTISNPDTLTFSIYKNGIITPLTLTLTSVSGNSLTLNNVGVKFLSTDVIDGRMTTVGNPNAGTFTAKILIL